MLVTTMIAIYGAALSTCVALWQIYTLWEQRRTKVEISVFDDWEADAEERAGWPLVTVRVVNHGDREISVNEIGLVGGDGVYQRFAWKVRWDQHRGLPAPIPPHQQLDLFCLAEQVATRRLMNTHNPVVARVRLGDNTTHESPPTKIDPTF
jgi:hypothetical protein